jgi:hypothetical protein
MKTETRKKLLGLSVAAALLLGTSTYAGKIVTDAVFIDGNVSKPVFTANKQFGFGGWNLDNINVKIVSILDYATALAGTVFDKVTGVYTPMSVDQSFESEISTGGEIRGKLHGKDWPVGEPSGIKIINDDLAVHDGDPVNCIITTSYLEGHYLDSVDPRPTTCSAGFQTHKRFKINMLSTAVDVVDSEGYGQPIELVFKLASGDTTAQRYGVLQKINNYSGKILDGYKVEVLDENGTKNPNLTIVLEKEIEDLANFSNGLWGPPDDHFPTQGFFDSVRAYYPVTVVDPQTVAFHGDIQGGNYMAVFRSNWLYSAIAPQGIFFDNDGDPSTDAALVAFFGVPPTLPADTTPGWYRGQVEKWAPVTQAQVDAWLADPSGVYTQDIIEDVLNLGITYTVNVGDNSKIGSTFIIRITPHVDGTSTDTPLPVSTSDSGGGGGFDALDNVSFIAMILGFLGIGAFIARRRLAKLKS